jgi:uncharacterized LabA/DUF88 family protein
VKKLCGERKLLRTYYYNVLQEPGQRVEGHREQVDFINSLRETPYMEVRLGGTKLAQGVAVEKGIDVMLATDLLRYAWSNLYDVAVLVSGDGDFCYAVQAAKDMGKHVEVAYFENNISRDLLDICDNHHLLNRDFLKGLWTIKNYPSRRRRSPRPVSKMVDGAAYKKAQAGGIENGHMP